MAWPSSEVTLLAELFTWMVGGSSGISFTDGEKKKTDRGISGGVSIVKLFCLAKVGEPLVSRPTTVQEVGFRPSNGRELRLTWKTSKDQVGDG